MKCRECDAPATNGSSRCRGHRQAFAEKAIEKVRAACRRWYAKQPLTRRGHPRMVRHAGGRGAVL